QKKSGKLTKSVLAKKELYKVGLSGYNSTLTCLKVKIAKNQSGQFLGDEGDVDL
ncbi:MAG: hypothetical protein K0S60_688, partial [Evtepia sp.]|nr:hypothetical protein [Evtepia sp.]